MTAIGSYDWMVEHGFTPDYGDRRWTHIETGYTAFRQPYMSEDEWLACKVNAVNTVERSLKE